MFIVPLVDCYYNFTKDDVYPVVKAIGYVLYVYDDFDELATIYMPEMAKSFALYHQK